MGHDKVDKNSEHGMRPKTQSCGLKLSTEKGSAEREQGWRMVQDPAAKTRIAIPMGRGGAATCLQGEGVRVHNMPVENVKLVEAHEVNRFLDQARGEVVVGRINHDAAPRVQRLVLDVVRNACDVRKEGRCEKVVQRGEGGAGAQRTRCHDATRANRECRGYRWSDCRRRPARASQDRRARPSCFRDNGEQVSGRSGVHW